MMAFRIVLVGAELGVMIEVPPRELTRRDPTGRRIQQPEDARRQRSWPLEDVVMQDLVQEDREVENREALHECQRYPNQGMLETNESPRCQSEDRELADADNEMA